MRLGILLLVVCVVALASAERSKRWVLKLENTQEGMDSESLDRLANQIAREHNFKLLRQVGDMKGYYMVEFNETHLESIEAAPGESHHHVRRKREAVVSSSADQLKSHPAVEDLVNEKILVRKKRDFMPIPNDMMLQTAVGFGKAKRMMAGGFHVGAFGGGGKRRNIGKLGKMRLLSAENSPRFPKAFVSQQFYNPHMSLLANDYNTNYNNLPSTDYNTNSDINTNTYTNTNNNNNFLSANLNNLFTTSDNSRIQDEDPMWPQMWYLNRNMYNPTLPDMNVTAAWAQGYSGRGVSVTFLDDGLEWVS